MNLDDLTGKAHDLDPGAATDVETIRVAGDAGAEPAIRGIIDCFGRDADLRAILLIVDGQEVGYLEREDVYEFVPAPNRGSGDSERASLPGYAFGDSIRAFVPGVEVPAPPSGDPSQRAGMTKLVCPVSPCPESPVYVATYDESDPLICRTHGQAFRPPPPNDEE